MKIKEITRKNIEKVGGKWRSDKDGAFWEVEANSFILHAESFLRAPPSKPLWIGFDCTIGHKKLAGVANLIMGDKLSNFVSLRWFQKSAYVDLPEQVENASLELMVELVDKLKAENINQLIEDFRLNRPDRPSMPQINHLAALAWLKDSDTLEDYQRIFAAGNHLNFVPMIDKAMIDRALEFAQK